GWQRQERALLPEATLAPLYFLVASGDLPLLFIKLPHRTELEEARHLGTEVAEACTAVERRAVVVAAGPLSARVLPGAPGGYHPEAAAFDEQVIERFAAGEVDELVEIDAARRRSADESVLSPLALMISAVGRTGHAELLSYEHPFGIGYL